MEAQPVPFWTALQGIALPYQVSCLALSDCFSKGNTANDSLRQPDCLNGADPARFRGGLAGPRSKLGHIREPDATTLWTPVYWQLPPP